MRQVCKAPNGTEALKVSIKKVIGISVQPKIKCPFEKNIKKNLDFLLVNYKHKYIIVYIDRVVS